MTVKPKPLLIPRRALAGAVLPLLGVAPLQAQGARVFRFDQSQGRLDFIARHLLVLTDELIAATAKADDPTTMTH